MRGKKVEKTKDTEADSQGGQTRGHQGQGLIQTELQAHRLNPPLLSPSKKISVKKYYSKYRRALDIAKRNREANKVLNIVVIYNVCMLSANIKIN